MVSVALGKKHEKGIGLHLKGHSWQLEVTGADEAAEAEVQDVTRGAAPIKWTVNVSNDRIQLDDGRFIPGHAYRVQIRKGFNNLSSSLVYLYPPDTRSKRSHVEFEEASASASAGSDELLTVPKNAL